VTTELDEAMARAQAATAALRTTSSSTKAPTRVGELLEGLPEQLDEDELDELCVHCGYRRASHRFPSYRCRNRATTFEGTGQLGRPDHKTEFNRALRAAERNGFVPLWGRDGRLTNEAEMRRMAWRGDARRAGR